MLRFVFSLLTIFLFVFPAPALAEIIPNDPLFDEQWYLEQIKAPDAWEVTTGSKEVIVAVLDSGVDLDHPDLIGNIWTNPGEIPGDGIDNDGNRFPDDVHGWDFVDFDNNPDPAPLFDFFDPDAVNHGTIISGMIGAVGDNEEGIAGVAWDVKIMPVRVLTETGIGLSSDAARGIFYAIENGADIITMSFTGLSYDIAIQRAIESAFEQGIVIVASVGNENADLDETEAIVYPACTESGTDEDWVIGVAATDHDDAKADFSNYGSCVDIAAPGVDVLSTTFLIDPDDPLAEFFSEPYLGDYAGTSVSVPQVAGAAALLLAVHPSLTPTQIRNILRLSVDPIKGAGTPYFGKIGPGRLNVAQALRIAPNFVQEQAVFAPSLTIVTAPASDHEPEVRRYSVKAEVLNSFFAYNEALRVGVRVAIGDIDGDGVEEIVTGANGGGGPHVRVFEQDGTVISQFFAYDETFRGGVRVAVGDIDGDGVEEIVTAPGAGQGTGSVRIFDGYGRNIGNFFPYRVGETRGVRIAVGDVDGDGIAEIVTALGPGGAPQVRVFEADGVQIAEIDAYEESFDLGLNVATGDVDKDGREEIVLGADAGGKPEVRVFRLNGELIGEFLAYDENFSGGVRISVGDTDGDGLAEIVTGAGPGGGPHVRLFNADGELRGQFFAHDEAFRGGVNVAVW
ncbi:S8 family serine peptidase [Patescibacteria group bacterium]|nr:S8 family serine peptidase [Patescibacteria group bacterium]